MNPKRKPNPLLKPVLRFVLAASLASPCALLPSALAQGSAPPTELKPVIVTGSNIPTVESEGPSPVLRITREKIDQSGAATISEVLRRIPQNNAGSFDEKFQNSFAPGSSGVSLRGLGQKNTLVLLNGRRLAPYGFAQNITDAFVDLNSLPLAAVDRIEVLKDGASAIYGSDAIAGVVNVILRKEYSGVEINARFGNTTEKNAFEQSYSLVGGTSTDDSSAMVTIDYFHRDSLFLRDRDFSRSANHGEPVPDAFGGMSGLGDGGFDLRSGLGPDPAHILAIPGTGNLPGYSRTSVRVNADGSFTAPAGTRNRYDFNPEISAIPETTRYGAFGVFNHKFYDWLELYVETSYRNVNTKTYAAPTPIVGDRPPNLYNHPGGVLLVVPASNPFNPFGADVTFRKRLVEAGPRINEIDTDAYRILPGLKFKIPDSTWEIETAMLYNRVQTFNQGRNYLHADRVQAALNDTNAATAFNVFGVGFANNPATIEAMKFRNTRRGESELLQGDIKANGTVVDIWGGPLGLAIGAEGRRERISDVADDVSLQEKQVASGGTSSVGDREAGSIFAEVSIPIVGSQNELAWLKSFDIQAAGRFENYSDFGDTAKPKVAGKIRPIKDLLLRASYSEGFRAPSLVELYAGKSVSYPFVVDSNTNSPLVDIPAQYRQVFTGNPNLDAEESESLSFGIMYEPSYLKGFSIYADFFRIDYTKAIDAYAPGLLIDAFPNQVDRDPNTQEITTINNTFLNLSTRKVEGVDFGVAYSLTTGIGDFTANADASYIHSWKDQSEPGGEFFDRAGSYQFPQWHAVGSLFWKYEKFGAGVNVNYVGSYDQANQAVFTEIASWTTFDLQASYELPWQFKATVGVLNVADKAPPFSDNDTEGYDITTHDPRGRFWYLALNKKF